MTADNTPEGVILGVSEFVALVNQTLEFAFSGVTVTGELANLRVSRNRWLYFDLKDDAASVRFFGTVYQMPGPLEDGMLLKVRGLPRLHPAYGFSVNVSSIMPAGEGTIRRAADLLRAKLAAEGLFDEARKRLLPYPPVRIGLITSRQAAAYADFIKILNARWHGVTVDFIDVQVQGEAAPAQIAAALGQFNAMAEPPEVVVLVRGGGSAEDLAAYSTEQVTRAVAASRVPTLAAIGHETDLSLAELAADARASTPSNAAELLVPDRRQSAAELRNSLKELERSMAAGFDEARRDISARSEGLDAGWRGLAERAAAELGRRRQLLEAFNPEAALKRGYALVRRLDSEALVRSAASLKPGDRLNIHFADGSAAADVTGIDKSERL
jgi:exodeoxyribonuclease VII large subunit